MANDVLNINTTPGKANEMVGFYQHFGYLLMETRAGNEGTLILVFQRRYDRNTNEVIKLEREYKKLDRKVPLASIIWSVVGFMLVALYISLTQMEQTKLYAGFAIPSFIVCFAISIFLLIIFFVILANKGKIQKRILLTCDRILGLIKEVPLQEFIEPMGEQTGMISRNIDSIVNPNVR